MQLIDLNTTTSTFHKSFLFRQVYESDKSETIILGDILEKLNNLSNSLIADRKPTLIIDICNFKKSFEKGNILSPIKIGVNM